MTDFLSLLSSIPSLISDFTGDTTAPYKKQQQQLADNQLQISNALTQGPGNPLYQSIFGQYKQQSANNTAATIAEAQAQNRMNSNMGRTPLFSQERGSENIFRNLIQANQNSGVQADQQTRAALGQAGGASMQGLDGYKSISPYGIAANKQQNTGYTGIYDLLRGFSPNQPQQQPSTGTMGAGNYSPTTSPAMPGYVNPNTNLYQQAPAYLGFQY